MPFNKAAKTVVLTVRSQSPFKADSSFLAFPSPVARKRFCKYFFRSALFKGPWTAQGLKNPAPSVLGEMLISGPMFSAFVVSGWGQYPPGNMCLLACRFRPASPDNTSEAIELIFQFCTAYSLHIIKIAILTITKRVCERAASLITTFLCATPSLTKVCNHVLFLSSIDCETSLELALVLSYSIFPVIK